MSKYKITDREHYQEYDKCIEFENGTYVWLLGDAVIETNDMLELEEVQTIVEIIKSEMIKDEEK